MSDLESILFGSDDDSDMELARKGGDVEMKEVKGENDESNSEDSSVSDTESDTSSDDGSDVESDDDWEPNDDCDTKVQSAVCKTEKYGDKLRKRGTKKMVTSPTTTATTTANPDTTDESEPVGDVQTDSRVEDVGEKTADEGKNKFYGGSEGDCCKFCVIESLTGAGL